MHLGSITRVAAIVAVLTPLSAAQSTAAQSPSVAVDGATGRGSGGSTAVSHVLPPPAPLVGGTDDCLAPDPITGQGAFFFDNTAATTGAVDGQTTSNCLIYALNGITGDVWFVWTSTVTGTVVLSTCGLTAVDTKIAVYAVPTGGPYCPGGGAVALACNDDIQGLVAPENFRSRLSWAATSGTEYLVQLGMYPGTVPLAVAGVGTFTIDPYVPNTTCQRDDGTTETAYTIGTQGAQRVDGWLQRVGMVGASTTVSMISTAWGRTNTGSPLPPGLTGFVGVFEDPNDDGDPTDAVLLSSGSAPMVGQHTDALQTIGLAHGIPVTATGVFFIAAWVPHTTGFPIPVDIAGCGGDITPTGWFVGNSGTTLNTTNLALNSIPPFLANVAESNLGLVFLTRADCMTSGPMPVGTIQCIGDGISPHTNCPCSNVSATVDAIGCLNSFGIGGSLRAVAGVNGTALASDSVVMTATNLPAASVLLFQGATTIGGGNGSSFGDGLRCAGGFVIRLKTAPAMGTPGAAVFTYPGPGDPSISFKGLVTMPGPRTYQAWYRNSALFCIANSTFNLTNGVVINWL